MHLLCETDTNTLSAPFGGFSSAEQDRVSDGIGIVIPQGADADARILAKSKRYGANSMKNLSNNLSIKRLKIVVNATSGAVDHSGDTTAFIDAERLFQMTLENCNSQYFKEGGFRAWRDFGCAVLLSSAQFAPGLQVCDGVSYPVSIRVEAELVNRAVGITALGSVGVPPNVATSHNNQQGAGQLIAGGHQLQKDFIKGQGQVTAIFTKVVLATTETSATTNSMNYPLDTAERLMAAAGQMR